MSVGRGDFDICSKKGFLMVSSGKKQISPLLASPRKIFGNPIVAPLEKIPSTPMHGGKFYQDGIFAESWKQKYLWISKIGVVGLLLIHDSKICLMIPFWVFRSCLSRRLLVLLQRVCVIHVKELTIEKTLWSLVHGKQGRIQAGGNLPP